MKTIYFGLGSNLGNRLQNLRDAVEKLKAFGKIERRSDVFASSAWGGVPQPDYLNACVAVHPDKILEIVKNFERELGRVPSVRWGARKIDIDILIIDDWIYQVPEVKIPHVSMPQRLFVLVPLEQIAPLYWTHPETGKNLREMIYDIKGSQPFPIKITKL